MDLFLIFLSFSSFRRSAVILSFQTRNIWFIQLVIRRSLSFPEFLRFGGFISLPSCTISACTFLSALAFVRNTTPFPEPRFFSIILNNHAINVVSHSHTSFFKHNTEALKKPLKNRIAIAITVYSNETTEIREMYSRQ